MGDARRLIEYSLDQADIMIKITEQVILDISETLYADVTQTASYYSEKRQGYGKDVAQETLKRARRIWEFLKSCHLDSLDLSGLREEIDALESELNT